MKGNLRRLSVFVGVPVIALFMMVGMASGDPAIPYGIKGEYAVTGFSSCGPGPGIMEANYTFSIDGTGSVSGVTRNYPPEAPLPVMAFMADFHYTVTQKGRIEFQYPDGGLKVGMIDNGIFIMFMQLDKGPSHGVISPDGNMITISCGPPVVLKAIDNNGDPIPGTDMVCVTSLTGMRIH